MEQKKAIDIACGEEIKAPLSKEKKTEKALPPTKLDLFCQ